MKRNNVRTSEELATLASHLLAGRCEQELQAEMLSILDKLFDKLFIEDLAKRLAGSVLSNRRE